MQTLEVKNAFRNLLSDMDLPKDFEEAIKDMIDGYENKDSGDFFGGISYLMLLLSDYRKTRIKAKGYDKIVAIDNNYKKNLAGIKEEYEQAIKSINERPVVILSAPD